MIMKKICFTEGKIIALALIASLILCAAGEYIKDNIVPATNGSDEICVPIIMYHSVLESPKKKTKYIVTPAQLDEDLRWLYENGYTTVVMQDIIDYVYEGKALPEKPVMITFDDGYYNNLIYAVPLLEKYGMKAVISVVGSFSDMFSESKDMNPSYAHLTWDDISELAASGTVEFQNHSYGMHSTEPRKGVSKLKTESSEEYKAIFSADVMQNQEKLSRYSHTTPTTYTYPYGYSSDESEEVLKRLGFLATLSCYEKLNYITHDSDCLYLLGRFNRDSRLSTASFMAKIK